MQYIKKCDIISATFLEGSIMEKEKFTVRFAETESEKNAAYALRYRDMLLEYRADAEHQDGLDITCYDEYARQIICIDNQTGEVVGCYRIVTDDCLPDGKPFVCEEEFILDGLKATGERIAELSRAVVKKEYRGTIVLPLLLRFVVQYIREKNYRFVIGEASFYGTDKHLYQKELSYLAACVPLDERFGVQSKEKEQIELLDKDTLDMQQCKRNLPPLIRAYQAFGAKFSKDSFTDRTFGSVDVFVLLDTQNYNQAYVNRLLKT